MTKVWKVAGVWLVMAAVVWLFTIWRWQTTDVMVSDRDIVLQLLVLPLLLTGALVGALWGLHHLRASVALESDATSPGAGPSLDSSAASSGADEALRCAQAWLLTSAVALPVGSRTDAAWATLSSQAARPSLDPSLLDHDGLPVFTCRAAWVDEALADADTAAEEHARPERVRRAWLLLQPVLGQLLDALTLLGPDAAGPESHPHPDHVQAPVSMKAHLAGVAMPLSASQQQSREAGRPHLTVRLVLPRDWAEEDRNWFTQAARQASGALLDWAERTGCRALHWQTTPPETPEALWVEIDQMVLRWQRDPTPALTLLLAVDSAVDADEVERRQARGELFTAHHQNGQVPGEAAAGLLLACPHWPRPDDGDAPPALLGRPAHARRGKSADAIGRVGIDALRALLDGVVGHRLAAPVDALTVVSDADHRGSRAAELYESVQESLPGLDPATQVVRVGEACGELGVARAVVPVVLAHAALNLAEDDAAAALAVLMQDGHERVVVPLSRPDRPHDEPAADLPNPAPHTA